MSISSEIARFNFTIFESGFDINLILIGNDNELHLINELQGSIVLHVCESNRDHTYQFFGNGTLITVSDLRMNAKIRYTLRIKNLLDMLAQLRNPLHMRVKCLATNKDLLINVSEPVTEFQRFLIDSNNPEINAPYDDISKLQSETPKTWRFVQPINDFVEITMNQRQIIIRLIIILSQIHRCNLSPFTRLEQFPYQEENLDLTQIFEFLRRTSLNDNFLRYELDELNDNVHPGNLEFSMLMVSAIFLRLHKKQQIESFHTGKLHSCFLGNGCLFNYLIEAFHLEDPKFINFRSFIHSYLVNQFREINNQGESGIQSFRELNQIVLDEIEADNLFQETLELNLDLHQIEDFNKDFEHYNMFLFQKHAQHFLSIMSKKS